MKTLLKGAVLVVAAMFLFAATPAQAIPITFDAVWSGASYGNNATASGVITLESTLLPNPGSTGNFSAVVAMSITVTGASSGNGTFTRTDFIAFGWNTNGATLDLTQQLVGQPTSGSPFGTHTPPPTNPNSGDFNFLGVRGGSGPTGTWFFRLTTNGGTGDNMVLTSLRQSQSVPEPAILTMLAVGGVGLLGLVRRRRK